MTKKDFVISLLLLVSGFTGYSQNDWRQGFIIENTGDTIYGLIDYRSQKSNSQYCYFKKDKQDVDNRYEPTEIKAYRFTDGKYYVSKPIMVDGTERTAFLEFLINGVVKIYYYKDKDDLYFLEKDGQIYELKNTRSQVSNEGNDYLIDQKEYIGIMRYLFQDAKMTETINRTELESKSLVKTAKKYHNEVSKDEEYIIYDEKKDKVHIDFGVTYGQFNKTVRLKENLSYKLDNNSSDFFGLVFNIKNIPGIYERFSLQVEFLASEYIQVSRAYHFDKNYNYVPITENRYQLNVPLMLDYRITATRLYPKIEFGASMYFTSNDLVKTQQMTYIAGLSLHYEIYKDFRFYLLTRAEKSPRVVRFGAGLVF